MPAESDHMRQLHHGESTEKEQSGSHRRAAAAYSGFSVANRSAKLMARRNPPQVIRCFWILCRKGLGVSLQVIRLKQQCRADQRALFFRQFHRSLRENPLAQHLGAAKRDAQPRSPIDIMVQG